LAQKLDNTLTKLSVLTDRLEAGEGTAGRLFKDPALYNNLDETLLRDASAGQIDRENPKKYLTFKVKIF